MDSNLILLNEEIKYLRERNSQLSKEADLLRQGLIKIRFYFDHLENEWVQDSEWVRLATSIGKRQIDAFILEANKANPTEAVLTEYFDIRPDNGYEE